MKNLRAILLKYKRNYRPFWRNVLYTTGRRQSLIAVEASPATSKPPAYKSGKEQFLHHARLMDLEGMTDPSSSALLTQRLWRRYGANAMELLEAIRENPDSAKLLIENAVYLRCEIEQAARREMITKLDDFLSRRSKISLVVRGEYIVNAQGLKEACEILFGDQAEAKVQEYIDLTAVETHAVD